MQLKEFFKPNKFKIIFLLVTIVITLIIFLTAALLTINFLAILFVILYFPALFFAKNFQLLPMFKHCSLSFGEELCYYDQTVAVILSVPIFILYVYIIACVIDLLRKKMRY